MKEKNLQEKYFETTRLITNTYDTLAELKDNQKLLDSEIDDNIKDNYDYFNTEHYKKIKHQEKEIAIKQKETQLLHDLIINNLISLEQDLLIEAVEYFKKHYKNKKIGEMTRKKFETEFIEKVKNDYNINIYCYLYKKETYNDTIEYAISIYFEDYYYQYNLKQEEVIYNLTQDEYYLYYYHKIDYIDIDLIDSYTSKLLDFLEIQENKIELLKNQLNDEISTYNNNCVGVLNCKRYRGIYLQQN